VKSAPPSSKRSALEAYFFALVLFLTLVSLTSLALVCLEAFRPLPVLVGAVASLAASTLFLRRNRPDATLSRSDWGALALVLLACALRYNCSVYIYGGQDPGVYTNASSYFADHGTWILKDELLDSFEGRPDLREYYITRTLRGVTQNAPNSWYGNMLPGFYLKDLEKNEWVAQFYHINTVWLSIGQWLFGIEWKGLTLALLSSLTVLAAYILAVRISSSSRAGLAAAFLLSTNAAHSYIGTFPVSEAVAGFFFLSALAMLSSGWFYTSILPFLALFLTRITGFLTAPLILISLAWIVVKRRDVRAVWTGLGIIAAYAASFVWGLSYSPTYARDIYRGKFGIPTQLLDDAPIVFVVAGLVWIAGGLLALRCRHLLTPIGKVCLRYKTQIAITAIVLILGAVAARGYLLAFTDHYAQHRWFGTRWNMADRGLTSVRYLSIYTFMLMLSPLGLAAFIVGLAHIGKSACQRASLAPIAVCAFGFFAALTIKQLTTPYLYYFGRYLVSELLPLAILCGVVTVDSIAQRLPRFRGAVLSLYCITVCALLFPALNARLKLREGHQFYEAMSCIDQLTPGRSIILIDKTDFAEAPIVTALRFTFGKSTFGIRPSNFEQPGHLKALIEYFQSKGYAVHLLSSQDTWKSTPELSMVTRIPAIMRKLASKTETPTKISTSTHRLRFYSVEKPATLPPICQKVEGYSR
jgi:hypothetical protein